MNLMKGWLLIAVFLLAACTSGTQTPAIIPSTQTAAPTRTETMIPSQTATRIPATLTQQPTVTDVAYQVCCPLEEETFDSLRLILVNPLKIPPLGHDDGHHGIDFAYFRRGERESIQGIGVYALIPGKVVLTLENYIPYGYAILIETPLSYLTEPLQEKLLTGYLEIPKDLVYQGQCPTITPPTMTNGMSVYHLYAHLEVRPTYQPGDAIKCGEQLGTVGNSGYSSNPHLHLETRLGPSGANFTTMAFYQTSYTEEQRANYCLWRMSGYYQLFDPFTLLESIEQGT